MRYIEVDNDRRDKISQPIMMNCYLNLAGGVDLAHSCERRCVREQGHVSPIEQQNGAMSMTPLPPSVNIQIEHDRLYLLFRRDWCDFRQGTVEKARLIDKTSYPTCGDPPYF